MAVPVYIDGYRIDCFTDESPEFSAQLTSEPVDTGADVTDHRIKAPDMITLSGVISDDHLMEGFDPDTLRSVEGRSKLLEIHDSGKLVTVETASFVYLNMGLERLTLPRTAQTGAATVFTATFRQVRVVRTTRTRESVLLPRAKKKSNKGNSQEAKDPNGAPKIKAPVKAQERASLLSGGTGVAGYVLGL